MTLNQQKEKCYSKKVNDKGLKLIVFYNGNAVLKGGSWSINGFLNHVDFEIHEVTFIQGINKEHDSFHVWYKESSNS